MGVDSDIDRETRVRLGSSVLSAYRWWLYRCFQCSGRLYVVSLRMGDDPAYTPRSPLPVDSMSTLSLRFFCES